MKQHMYDISCHYYHQPVVFPFDFSSHVNHLVVELLSIATHGFHVLKQLAQDDKDGDLYYH